jgi:molybdate transport system ATP-binding protein
MGLLERIRSDMAIPILHVSHDRAEVDRLAGLVVEMA